MGYNLTIKSNVARAFKLLGDLAAQVTFSSQQATGFDFATNQPQLGAVTTTTALVVEIKTKKNKVEANTLTKTIIMQSGKIPNISDYDTVTFPDGSIWQLVVPSEDDGYIVTLVLTRNA